MAQKPDCSHKCKHESLHPKKTSKKSTSHTEEESDTTKKVKNTEPALVAEHSASEVKIVVAQEVQLIEAPVTVTTAPTPVEAPATETVTPAVTTIEIAQVPAIKEEVATDIEPKVIEIQKESTTVVAENTLEQVTQQLTQEETKELRLQLADATSDDLINIQDIEDIKAFLEEVELSVSQEDFVVSETDVKTAAITPAQEAASTKSEDAQEDMNNLTQVMI